MIKINKTTLVRCHSTTVKHQEILNSSIYRKPGEVEKEERERVKEVSLVLIPHGSLERPPKQDYDRFLFSSYAHFFFSASSFSSSLHLLLLLRLFLFYSFVIVVRKVRVVVLDTTHHKIFFFYSLSFFFF
jgi:hypothetical protein